MRKIETIWHHILWVALTEKRFKFTQKELAEEFQFSLSTVNHAIEAPVQIGAIRKTSKFFVLQDYEKLLYYWASVRNLGKDIIYRTSMNERIGEIEGLIPPGSVFACYTAAKVILKEPQTEYGKVYFYASDERLNEIERRFPPISRGKGMENVYVLKMPAEMLRYGVSTTLPQTFVDLWNLADWYARDFTGALRGKFDGLLS